MKKIKTCITNPELVKVGQYCEVLMSTKWMEMSCDDPYIYLPAKITSVSWRSSSEFPYIMVRIRKCAKRGNYWSVENVMILPSQIGKKVQDHIKDYKTIIFK